MNAGAVTTKPVPRGRASRAGTVEDRRDSYPVPALIARPGGIAERFAHSELTAGHPVAVFVVALLLGFVALIAVSAALGLVVVHVLVSAVGLGGLDNDAISTLAHHRTATLTSISAVGSQVGGAPVLPILAGVIAIACAIARRWRIAAFAVFALAAESATYRITTLLVPRDRPPVHRLESLPVNASYPSGHTAASLAVYAGLVLLLTSRLTSSMAKALAWTFAILMVMFVALSRMYRGMHHPLDVAGGALVGVGAVLVVLFACRAAGVASRARHERRTDA
jgi:membrane-associated phospholipid phosphatase